MGLKERTAAAVLGVCLCVILGIGMREKREQEEKGSEILKTVCEENPESQISLTEEEEILLDTIGEALEQGEYEKAARMMMDQEECLYHLYYEKMNGKRYLYQGRTLTENLDGKGLVIKKYNSVYYGELSGGLPEGKGTALQTVVLDSRRFDYSAGQWKNGKMEGEGIAGYYYYEGVEEENRSVRRTGTFREDVMQGTVIYQTSNARNQNQVWEMEIKDGKIVLDEEWIFDEEKGVYQLLSLEDQEHAYVVEKEGITEVRFQNLIPW